LGEQRFLTKSRFKLASECPTKLFYTKKDEYADLSKDDTFLEALAQGGYQGGEFAKGLYPGGTDIETLNTQAALERTNTCLQAENALVFEAAIQYENFFIRVDILRKRGDTFELIEVKAKSYDPGKGPDQFISTRGGGLIKAWRPYLEDVAFQKWVVERAFPDKSVTAALMLVDKTSVCDVHGLNQKFKIRRDKNGMPSVSVSGDLSDEDRQQPLLTAVSVDSICDMIWQEIDERTGLGFAERIALYADRYVRDKKIPPQVGPQCKDCQFQTKYDTSGADRLSGFRECWGQQLDWTERDFDDAVVLDIWGYRGKQNLFDKGVLKIKDVSPEDIGIKEDDQPGLSRTERQWLQVEKVQNADASAYIDKDGLRQELATWQYPLNFIDFETAQPALPFTAGMRPYEGIAFQFSHHVLHEDGRVAHAGEFVEASPGAFPNFAFIRALKRTLEANVGTIFRYGDHENTYLNMIEVQLLDSGEHDRDELIQFIRSVTQRKEDGKHVDARQREGGYRNMVDLIRLVKRYYYAPETRGSNSIKAVLPALLNQSDFLKKRYSQPIYGTEVMPSRNFPAKQWIQFEADSETVIDPYKQLPPLFEDIDIQGLEISDMLSDDQQLKDGGAAMVAYSKLQFSEMSDYEREELIAALKKYCELDTLAMVMIVEAWRDLVS